MLSNLTVQDCPKGYVHHANELCRKCGRKGVEKTKAQLKEESKMRKSDTKKSDATDDKPNLAEAISRIADGMQQLLKSGLNRRAIVVLLRDATGCNKTDIERVLDGLQTLARDYAR